MAGVIEEPLRRAHEYLLSHYIESENKAKREAARDYLKPFIMAAFEADENGNFYYEFPDPIAVDYDRTFIKGLLVRRRVSEYVNEERADELVVEHNLQDRCFRETVSYDLDLDELYAANQEGIISDDEIDSIIETDFSYSLEKVKA